MSLLPPNNSPWPLNGTQKAYRRFPLLSAWYAGDPNQLQGVYGDISGGGNQGGPNVPTTLNPQGTPGPIKRVWNALRGNFWAPGSTAEQDTRRHLDTPKDIAQLGSELLFSDPPRFIVTGPTETVTDADGKPVVRPIAAVRAAQQRLDKRLDAIGFNSTLLATCEVGNVLGYSGLRIGFDKAVLTDGPAIQRVDADRMVPIYQWGQLAGVLFWTVVQRDKGGAVWRHIELHQDGAIYHALYVGGDDKLGERRPLSSYEPLAALARKLDTVTGPDGVSYDEAVRVLPPREGATTAISVPNMLPDPLDRGNEFGRSDFTPAVLDLFDAIDKTYTEMMDAIDDAKSRLVVSQQALNVNGPGQGTSFNPNQRVFLGLNVPPSANENGALPIEKIQFDPNVASYLSALEWLGRKVIEEAGYNSQASNDSDGTPITATQYTGQNKRSMTTRDKKIRYWEDRLAQLLTSYLMLDVLEYGPSEMVDGEPVKVGAYPVRVEFPEAVQPSQLELANLALALKNAEAASIEVRVRTVHPDWDDTRVSKEVEDIQNENAAPDPVTFGAGGAGVGPGDGI